VLFIASNEFDGWMISVVLRALYPIDEYDGWMIRWLDEFDGLSCLA